MKVLVAEDDRNILAGIVEVLEDEGYEPLAARDGEEALRLFSSQQPDFVVLDIMMPRVNGYDVCRQIRQQNSTVPLLFLSAKSEEIDKVLGLELGADDYLSKPFGIKEFVARIRAVSRRCQSSPPPDAPSPPPASKSHDEEDQSFELGDLTVFPRELRARRQDHSIDLSPRDVKILSLLSRHAGQVLQRDTLFCHCWGAEYYPNSRTLDQHISQLRKKIEQDPKDPQIIQTVHGAGYRYDP